MYVLTPKLPASAAKDALLAYLTDTPPPAHLVAFLRAWLSELEESPVPNEGTEIQRLRVFGLVLLDLANQDWSFTAHPSGELHATPPYAADTAPVPGKPAPAPAEVKQALRAGLITHRDEQLREPAVQRFVRNLEQPRRFAGRVVSVRSLLANPQALAADLQACLAAPTAARTERLQSVVKPYLQAATTNAVDPYTGLRLQDIWRYCRYTWTLPYQTQPGRRMFYLVRDAARPLHPIIGIGALGSSVVQISVRDEAVGWSLKALRACDNPAERLRALQLEIDRALTEIYHEDFLEDQLLTPQELAQPTAATGAYLREEAMRLPLASSQTQREIDDLTLEARSPLFRRKRALALGDLLEARYEFQQLGGQPDDAALLSLLASATGKKAVSVALRGIKKRHVAASIMEITTCGALPPYNHLLGGKLVALLMASPQVLADYQERYAAFASVIASRMRGLDLFRRANLVLLGTTSLYHTGSSQYNRLKVPVARGTLEYKLLGKTVGYGSVHLSGKTYEAIQKLLQEDPAIRHQSNRFAAGVNYKIRSIAAVLAALGLQKLQKHATPRLVYLVPTANNWQRYLLGIDEQPDWIYDNVDAPQTGTTALIESWKNRWFIPRAQTPQIIHKLFGANRIEPLGSHHQETQRAAAANQTKFFFLGVDKLPMLPWQVFAQLHDGRLSFAEKLTPEELEIIHIESPDLEQGIIDLLRAGCRIYLTGNPGDGKTHLIQRLRPRFEALDVLVQLDASAVDPAALAADLHAAAAAGRPALVAINEGPLRQLLDSNPDLPDAAALAEQLLVPFTYASPLPEDEGATRSEEDAPATVVPTVLLLNLGTRQVLTPELLEIALKVALRRVDYFDAPEMVKANRQALLEPRVQGRLSHLLDLVRQGGSHVTMHQLLGMLARLLTGGVTSITSAAEHRPYYQVLFDPLADSPLAAALAELDPAALPHAHLDTHELWDRPAAVGTWLAGRAPEEGREPAALDHRSGAAEARFRELKRQFYFENELGEAALAVLPLDRASFSDLLQDADNAPSKARREVLTALGRFVQQPSGNSHAAPGARAGGGPALSETDLYLWQGLRYDADKPPTVLVAGNPVPQQALAVQLPQLPRAQQVLLAYAPDHLRLALAGAGDHDPALLIDLELWSALQSVARGQPAERRPEQASRRISRFLAALAKVRPEESAAGVVWVHDVRRGVTEAVELEANRTAPNGLKYVLS